MRNIIFLKGKNCCKTAIVSPASTRGVRIPIQALALATAGGECGASEAIPLRPQGFTFTTEFAPMHDAMETISEAEGKDLLRAAGISVPERARTTGKAAVKADTLGYPVVLKMMGPKLAHKTEAGAVTLGLGLGDGDAVRATVTR